MFEKDFLNRIEKMISNEIQSNMTEEHKLYVAGMSDVYELLKKEYDEQLKIGRIYYVIVHEQKAKLKKSIQEMVLYKITDTDKRYYSFSKYINQSQRTNEIPVTLSSKMALNKRVFKSKKEAEENL